MYKVYYKYDTRLLGCGCCSESANILEVFDLKTGKMFIETDSFNTLCSEGELIECMESYYLIDKSEIVLDSDNEYL
jgi:hypothetical protein